MHALLLDEALHSTSGDTTVRVVVGSVSATNTNVLVVLDRVHRESFDDLVLVLALLVEPYRAGSKVSALGYLDHSDSTTHIVASSPTSIAGFALKLTIRG
jgi:hypothetical protein